MCFKGLTQGPKTGRKNVAQRENQNYTKQYPHDRMKQLITKKGTEQNKNMSKYQVPKQDTYTKRFPFYGNSFNFLY